ncbi:hypothetical protein JOQ06_022487, partial [Pogonophryne albipinna]
SELETLDGGPDRTLSNGPLTASTGRKGTGPLKTSLNQELQTICSEPVTFRELQLQQALPGRNVVWIHVADCRHVQILQGNADSARMLKAPNLKTEVLHSGEVSRSRVLLIRRRRCSVNTDFNAATSTAADGLHGAALPGGFKGGSGSQTS